MPPPLTRRQLEPMGCGMSDCGHDHTVLFFHCRHHPGSGLDAAYDKRTGLLTIQCNRCHTFLCSLAIQDEEQTLQ